MEQQDPAAARTKSDGDRSACNDFSFPSPIERPNWLQSMATFLVIFWYYVGAGTTGAILLYYALWSRFVWVALLYMAWYIWDIGQPNRGSRRMSCMRNLKIYQLLAAYFPVTLTKTANLSPEHNYIFGYHPHGVFAVGNLCSFCTDITGFGTLFPGLIAHPLASRLAFLFPLAREFFLATGVSNSSKENIRHITQTSKSNAIVLIVGGAQESLDAEPGGTRLVLKHRKGFIRMALKTGSHLVPVYGFGENDLFRQLLPNPVGSRVRSCQRCLQRFTGFAPIVVYGRGLMPYRRSINVVVGKPIPVTQTSDPTEEEVDRLHQRYKDGLTDLFNAHREANGYGDKELDFI